MAQRKENTPHCTRLWTFPYKRVLRQHFPLPGKFQNWWLRYHDMPPSLRIRTQKPGNFGEYWAGGTNVPMTLPDISQVYVLSKCSISRLELNPMVLSPWQHSPLSLSCPPLTFMLCALKWAEWLCAEPSQCRQVGGGSFYTPNPL